MHRSYFNRLHHEQIAGVIVQYETLMGSMAYGADIGDTKDIDIYGWAFPSRELMFPYEYGIVAGFNDKDAKTFEQYQKTALIVDGQEIDMSMYGLPKYMRLIEEGNPNMLDSLFTRDEDVLFITERGKLLRDRRQMFLSKNAVRKCLGFANSELKRVKTSYYDGDKSPRQELIKKYGYDTKSAYHLVRILHQGFQMASEHDLDIYTNERSAELKFVRTGGYVYSEFEKYATHLTERLEEALFLTTLRQEADKTDVLELLMDLLSFYNY